MTSGKTRRHSKSKRTSNSRSKSRSGKKGGFGGWSRQTLVGSPWVPAANNSPSALAAHANHFAPSPHGVQVGGLHPAVPEFNGPGINDGNILAPELKIGSLGSGKGGGFKRRGNTGNARSKKGNTRSKKGGFVFGGFPQVISTAWHNAGIGIKNIWNGYTGLPQLPSASGWNQPSLTKGYPVPTPKPFDFAALKQAANQRVATF